LYSPISAISFGIIEASGSQLVEHGDDLMEPLAVIAGGVVFLVGANVCYTLGWITEVMWSEGDTSRTEAIRQKVYRRGPLFSAVIAAAPGVLVPLLWFVFGFR
jgi:hypothetical protein